MFNERARPPDVLPNSCISPTQRESKIRGIFFPFFSTVSCNFIMFYPKPELLVQMVNENGRRNATEHKVSLNTIPHLSAPVIDKYV